MGKIIDAFKREFGKNTGKAVSTWIFGDAHATPYKRVDQAKESRLKAHSSAIEERIRRECREQMYSLDKAVLENIDKVVNIEVPDNKADLIALLSKLSVHLRANKWHSRFLWQDKVEDRDKANRNNFCDTLFSKYLFCLKKLQFIDNSEPLLFYFESIARKAKRNRFWQRYKIWLLLLALFFLLFAIPVMGGIFAGNESAIAIAWKFGVAVLVIVGPIISFRIVKHMKLKKLRAPKPSCQGKTAQKVSHMPSQMPHIDKRQSIYQNTYDTSVLPNKDTIVDLNERNRIELRLAEIWNRYHSLISAEIFERKPIFASEGIKNSLLFVGVNPSYNPDDDQMLERGKLEKTLYYESQYRRLNTPKYFEELEKFADKIGYPYSHINLLYARENNRDALLNLNKNFIREQLELTYDTILQINPAVIVLFSEYAQRLILGKGRWVDPDIKINGTYCLRGTSIPVFFSEDIMEMTCQSCETLICAIRQRIN